jgi:LysR family transcriptional regulator, positive regulator for ilvC
MVSLGFGVGVLPKIVLDNSPLKDQIENFIQQPDLGPYAMGICVMQKKLKSPIVNAFWERLLSSHDST